jgi:Na+/H+ antiporter
MNPLEIIFALVLAGLGIAVLAKRLDQPYPIALLLAGLALAFLPGVPAVRLDPQLVFYVLLPPILSEAAYFTSWRDFVMWKRPILLLAFGLVTATSAVVAAICVYFIPGMNWATGFVLGAIVSPPDAAAATSIMRGLGLPRRIVQVLEGESLVNDAAGLTVYRFAVAAAATGAFSLSNAAVTFVWIAAGGIAVGMLLGFLYVRIYPWLKDPEVEVLSTFILSYLSYFAAETVHASGVLAVVASGLLLGWHAPELFSATARIRAEAVWQTVIFLINVIIFILIGLQLPEVAGELQGYPVEQLATWCVVVSGGVVAIRMLWVFPGAYLPRVLFRKIREREPSPSWQQVTVVGWTGLRGVVSLAAALSLPQETAGGLPFPYRSLLLLLTFAVIVSTLVLQGLTLRPFVKMLRLPVDRSSEEEQLAARIHSTERVLERIAELEEGNAAPDAVMERIRGYYADRLAEFKAQLEVETGTDAPEKPEEFQSIAEQRIWWELARIEREAVVSLRRNRKIGDEAMHRIERDIDLLEARIIPR